MKNKQVKVIGISGSIRSNYKHLEILNELIKSSSIKQEFVEKIEKIEIVFSNTDISVGMSLIGAQEHSADVELISITKLFEHKNQHLYENFEAYKTVDDIEDIDTLQINNIELEILLKKIKESNGVVLGTPVYFGDRSSVANKLLQITAISELLKEKAFGVISVGAKRNGGQETTNIYSLYDALMQNSIVVGNGPKTSQYGGTVFAGDVHSAHTDEFGLETSYGTGRQVAYLSQILKNGNEPEKKALNIKVLVTMDTSKKKFDKEIAQYFHKYALSHNIEIINLTDNNIYRCVACSVCPSPKLREKNKDEELPYNCIVQTKKDVMHDIQEALVGSDCIIIAGANTQDDLIYRYQAFMERTRFIRREDFELTNIPIIGLLVNEIGAVNNPIHNVKVLTSFIRHNTFILKPIEITKHKENEIHKDEFIPYIDILLKIKKGRAKTEPLEVSYKATGYKDKSLDSTSKARK